MTHPADTPRSGGTDETPGPAEIARLIRALRQDLVLLRQLLTAAPSGVEDAAEDSPRKLTVGSAAKWGLIAYGALGLGIEIAGMLEPDLVGPLQELQRLVRGLL